MGVSTDGILFYGYHLPETSSLPMHMAANIEQLIDELPGDSLIQVDYHCSDEAPMPFIYWNTSHIEASRGNPKLVDLDQLRLLPADVDQQLLNFAKEHHLPAPGEEVEYGQASTVGWWLTSWWG